MAIQVIDGAGATKYYETTGAGGVTNPFQSVIPDYKLQHAVKSISDTYSDTVDVWEKGKTLIKYGKNLDIDAGVEETVWLLGGNETYQTTNAIDEVVSDNAGDTQSVVIEGHTISGSDYTFVTQTATLNGTTGVTLTTPLARANRLYNNDSTDFAGTVSVYENGGTTHLSSSSDNNQSLKCATTISSVDYWIVTQLVCSVRRSNNAQVDFELQIRESGKVFREAYPVTVSRDSGSIIIPLDPYIIVRPNSDVRMVATSNAANTEVSSAIHGYLAVIT